MRHYVRNDEAKESAFRGICNMIAVYRHLIRKDLPYFCAAVTSWIDPPSDLKEQFAEVNYEKLSFDNYMIGCKSIINLDKLANHHWFGIVSLLLAKKENDPA